MAKATQKPAKSKPKARRKPAAKPKPAAKSKSKPAAKSKPKPAAKKPRERWVRFVEEHGVVLASARGPVPCVAEAVVGEPIVGSWWAHPKGQQIFEALSSLDDSPDVRCFRLVDHKITFVHRRLWPALARLAHDGVLDPARVASVQQEHMPTGEHRNFEVAFPDWLPDDAAAKAQALSADAARAQLGPWLD